MTAQPLPKEFPDDFTALMEITDRPPITFTQGRGGYLWDNTGKRYLDASGGAASSWSKAVRAPPTSRPARASKATRPTRSATSTR